MLGVVVSVIIINTVPGQELLIPIFSLAILLIPHLVYGFIFSFFFERLGKNKSSLPVGQKQVKIGDGMPIKTPSTTTPSPSTTTSAEIDYKKEALLRAIVVSAIALPIMYFGFNRLFSHPLQQQQLSSSSSSSILPQNSQFISKSRPRGFEDAILTPLIDAEETRTYLFYRIDKNPIVTVVLAAGWDITSKD